MLILFWALDHAPFVVHDVSVHSIPLRKFAHTNLPKAGFELRSLGPQAGTLPTEPPLLVQEKIITF